jgi:hypothetical protein
MTPATAKSSARVERVVEQPAGSTKLCVGLTALAEMAPAAAKSAARVEHFVEVLAAVNVKLRVRRKSQAELRPIKELRGWR